MADFSTKHVPKGCKHRYASGKIKEQQHCQENRTVGMGAVLRIGAGRMAASDDYRMYELEKARDRTAIRHA